MRYCSSLKEQCIDLHHRPQERVNIMIPQISQAPGVVQLVLNFLQELEQQGFTGDTATSYADRLTMSTDNSIYQLLPDAVVFPRSTADVALIARLAAQERYSSLIFTPAAAAPALTVRRSTKGLLLICPAI